MSESANSDVLIIGGGVIGLCAAWYLLQAGRGVTVLERERIGAGASHGNCGTITPSHAPPLAEPGAVIKGLKWMLKPDAPFYIKPRLDPALWRWLLGFARRCNRRDYARVSAIKAALLNTSRDALDALLAEAGIDCSFTRSGLLYVFRSAREFEACGHWQAELGPFGIEAEIWDRARVEREEPALRPGVAGGIHFPGDACLRPDRLLSGLAAAVRAAGGVIREQAEVTGFQVENGRVAGVRVGAAVERCVELVLATGAWSPLLARQLGLRIPIQPGKGYSLSFARPQKAPGRPLVLKEPSVCVTTWADGFRLGSTMEFSGYDASLNPVRLAALRRGAAEFLHEPGAGEPEEAWYGWRPMTWDDLPILGRAPGLANLTLATGHGMLGVSLCAISGVLVRDFVTGAEPVLDPAPLSPARFG
jgi:D-amino-acid dehydrogenase